MVYAVELVAISDVSKLIVNDSEPPFTKDKGEVATKPLTFLLDKLGCPFAGVPAIKTPSFALSNVLVSVFVYVVAWFAFVANWFAIVVA